MNRQDWHKLTESWHSGHASPRPLTISSCISLNNNIYLIITIILSLTAGGAGRNIQAICGEQCVKIMLKNNLSDGDVWEAYHHLYLIIISLCWQREGEEMNTHGYFLPHLACMAHGNSGLWHQ